MGGVRCDSHDIVVQSLMELVEVLHEGMTREFCLEMSFHLAC